MPRSLLSIVLFVLAAVVLTTALVVPTGAVTVDQPSSEVAFQVHERADGNYAGVSDDGELELRFDRLNDRAESQFDEVFVVVAGEGGPFWIEHDVEGVTFYVDEPGNELDEQNAVELEANESVTVGVEVDTHVAESGAETFTVATQKHETENKELPSRQTAALGGPLALCLLFLMTAANYRRKL